nr:RNA-binding S4 domain-containing protein [Calycomorphotria hydatis]
MSIGYAENMESGDNSEESIRLDQFLKLAAIVGTGGQAKMLIQDGQILVNGEVETRRRRKLVPGDCVICEGEEYFVATDEELENSPE